jgi:hypothetical protein
MNKQELINKFREIGIYSLNIFGTEIKGIPTESAICLIEQLDEPEKVIVPQCVADWIEECKKKGDLSLGGAIQLPCPEIYEWLMAWLNQETFARAWLDGYEVEEEKRYFVKIKATGQCLGKYYLNNEILYPRFIYTGRNADDFTRKELEQANFGWVFDCEGIEIVEVEE